MEIEGLQEFTVVRFFEKKGYGFARLQESGEEFYFRLATELPIGSKIKARVNSAASAASGRTPELTDIEVIDVPPAFEPILDEEGFEEMIVCHWNPERNFGIARPPRMPHRSSIGVALFEREQILSFGEESLKPGSKIRGRRMHANDGKDYLYDIEIYTPKDSDFVAVMSRSRIRTKVYASE